MEQIARSYLARFSVVIVLYFVMMAISFSVIDTMATDNPLRYLVALLPIPPVIFGMVDFVRLTRYLDELQRRIYAEGIGFGLGVTGVFTFAIGFLEAAGLPKIGMIWVFPMMLLFLGIGFAMASRRYS